MIAPTHADAFEVLCLQAGDNGRGDVLFGECVERARTVGRPFMVGDKFPDVYLECPLIGEPFLDVTVLYDSLETGTRVNHPAATGTEAMLDWFAGECPRIEGVCCGFELDVKEPELPAAAIHFQPRTHTDLVRPFCESVGEFEKADLYLELADRMPAGWPLSFFGMFRGRPGSPLRICGYLHKSELAACAGDPRHLASAFDEVGFYAYDDAMLAEVSAFLSVAPGVIDFQFDVYPGGSVGDTFAIDVQFEIEQPEDVQESFSSGGAGRLMRMFEEKGVADDRWKLVPEAAFARALNAQRDNGTTGRYSFALMPRWAKLRWRECVLQPAKMYFMASAGFLESR